MRDLETQAEEQRAISTELQAALLQKEGELRTSIQQVLPLSAFDG